MSDKPIVIEITKEGQGWPVGAELGVDSLDAVKDLYPGAKVLRYQNGDEHPAALKRKAPEPSDRSEASVEVTAAEPAVAPEPSPTPMTKEKK